MRLAHAASVVLVCALVSTTSPMLAARAFQSAQSTASEAPLTNADVIKLSQLGLGDEVVIAKVKQAATVNFDLSTDGIERLKTEKVSSAVIAEMLKRTTAAPSPAPAAGSGRGGPAGMAMPAAMRGAGRVMLVAGGVEHELKPLAGDMSTVYAYIKMLIYYDYHEFASRTRIPAGRPTFVLEADVDPRGYFYLVKADPDRKKNKRSVKAGGNNMYTYSSKTTPDEDWTIPYDYVATEPGKWQLTLKADLKPGEYGVLDQRRQLFDFGVDK